MREVEVIAPFTLTGVAAFAFGPQASFAGEGMVRLILIRQTFGNFTGFYLGNAVYTFGPVAEGVTNREVPEPMTLLLLGSGLASLGILRKRRVVGSRN